MKRQILFLVCLATAALGTIHAQHDVLTAGGDISSGGGSVAFSIGQVAYTNFSGTAGSVAQGVQQPNFFNIVATDDPDQDWILTLYPNPADQLVYVDLKDDRLFKKFNKLNIRLFDVQGKLLSQKNITEIVTPFPLTAMTDAVYILQLWQDQQPLKSFKLYKSN
jgi:hypothetical protein